MATRKSTAGLESVNPHFRDTWGRPIKHGMSFATEYRVWIRINNRCYNAKATGYHRYGGRGIKVCDRWRAEFMHFFEDMGRRPSLSHSIDRIDNDGDYEPGNCRWATRAEQNRNRCNSVIIEHEGRLKNLADWAREAGLNRQALAARLRNGWSMEAAISTPVAVSKFRGKPGVKLHPVQPVEGGRKYRGIQFRRSAWVAQICVQSKNQTIGRYEDPITAALAYDREARRLRGDQAITNFSVEEAARIEALLDESAALDQESHRAEIEAIHAQLPKPPLNGGLGR